MRQRSALEILEASVNLLRSLTPATIAIYLAGAVPFNAGVLYFVTDMARNPFAPERLPLESLLIAVLLIWKSTWQARFAAHLYNQLSMAEPSPTPWLRLIATQAMIQPLSLILLPITILIALPFPGCFAYFRAVGLFAALGEARPASTALQQSRLWLKQNSLILTFVSLAGLLLFGNVLITIALLPQLGRSFLGIEGELARLGGGILNLSTIAVSATIAWLVTDALLEAAYVIRCFHGESRASGRDLSVALRRWTAAAIIAVVLCLAVPPASAQTAEPQQQSMDIQRLDESIHEVIRQREFAWRTARTPGPEPEGRWVGWFRGIYDALKRAANWVADRIRDLFPSDSDKGDAGNAASGTPPLEIWMLGAAVVLMGGAAAVLFRSRGKATTLQPASAAVSTVVNVADDSVTADQLPESSWLTLAEELLSRGDCRLALRALYLAGLNHLGEMQLVSIRRWKTGRDYRAELERRARSRNSATTPSITEAFKQSVNRFEVGWYGPRAVERADVEALASSLEEMRRYVRGA